MANNKSLYAAHQAKQDEFYTQLSDIEKEMRFYEQHFKGKTVLCNCDDPRVSNFFHFFSYNFERLGLKRLITTCYKSQERDCFSLNECERAIWLEYLGDTNGNRIPDPEEIGIQQLEGDGDFRSWECIELLKQADIVVTNPPFSLFREYVAQLMKYKKKFIILGNQNNVMYKDIFSLFKENKIWLGSSLSFCAFKVPEYYEERSTRFWIDETGQKWRSFGNICWYTNLDIKKRHESMILTKNYTPEAYPHYENYDAIEVSKTADIPKDYTGVMGVPVTFLDKYNPEQFEIVGTCENEDLYGLKTRVYSPDERKQAYFAKFGKEGSYDLNRSGVVIRNGLREQVYQRILIRHKHPETGESQ